MNELMVYLIGFLFLPALVALAVQGVLLYFCGRWFVPVVALLTVGILFIAVNEREIFCSAPASCNSPGDAVAPILVASLFAVWLVTALATSIVHAVRDHRREQADNVSNSINEGAHGEPRRPKPGTLGVRP
jgi:putative effector of murein hydrolase LrgA (UPF0299 family)